METIGKRLIDKQTEQDLEFAEILSDMINRRMYHTGDSKREATLHVLEYLDSLPIREMKEQTLDD